MAARGFTLIELILVVGIATLVGVVSFARGTTLREDQHIKKAADDLQSIIRAAQANASTSVKCTASGSSSYSIGFTPQTVTMSCPGGLVKTLNFTNNVKICSISYSGCITGDNCTTSPFASAAVSTTFAQLSGKVSFEDSRCTPASLDGSSNMVITLKKDGSTDTKLVTVTKGGAVEIR